MSNNNNFFGVLMGFNRYDDSTNFPNLEFAEHDAEELYNTLVDPKYGNYPKDNLQLLTGEVTNDRIQRALNIQIVKKRKKSDTVLVYYSGHGFIAGDPKKTYLGTPETNVTHLLENPLAGLQIQYLQDLFLESQAGNVIFIIDCCHSGAFLLSPYRGKEDIYQLPLVDERYYKSEGRIAFVSCPRGVMARESSDHQHGIFTYYLLEGLKSKAVEAFSGEVTMESLISYVEAKAPASQPPIHYGHSKRLVLTSPKESDYRQFNKNLLSITINTPIDLPGSKEIYSLSNPLENHLSIIDLLMRNLENNPQGIDVSQRIIEAVRKTLNSEFAFVVRGEKNFRVYDKFDNALKE